MLLRNQAAVVWAEVSLSPCCRGSGVTSALLPSVWIASREALTESAVLSAGMRLKKGRLPLPGFPCQAEMPCATDVSARTGWFCVEILIFGCRDAGETTEIQHNIWLCSHIKVKSKVKGQIQIDFLKSAPQNFGKFWMSLECSPGTPDGYRGCETVKEPPILPWQNRGF